jgi:hypothetical protein
MGELMLLDAKAPATMEALVEVVMRLSTRSEAQVLELVSAGKLGEVFPFCPKNGHKIPPDFVSEDDLVEASALPLKRVQRSALMPSGISPSAKSKRPRVQGTARTFTRKKLQGSSED